MYHTISFLGERKFYDTLEDLFASHYYGYPLPRVYYTYSCQRVGDDILIAARDRLYFDRVAAYWKRKEKKYVFRRGPVPNTTGRWNRKGRSQKPPRYKFLLINKEYLRGVETETSIYDRWDYKNRGNEKNWKSQRKTQYKPVYKSFE